MIRKIGLPRKNILRLFSAVLSLFSVILISQNVFAESVTAENPYLAGRFSEASGKLIDKVGFPGKPPKFFRMPVAEPVESNIKMGLYNLSNVPAFKWSYGCSATSGAMMAGYYDNNGYPNMYTGPENSGVCPLTNEVWGETVYPSVTCVECPLSATHLGYDDLTDLGHVDDYWVDYEDTGLDPWIGNWAEHVYADCTGDFMKTNQSAYGNVDGSTWFFFYGDGSPTSYADLVAAGAYGVMGTYADYDGGCGLQDFFESRGYTVTSMYNQYIEEIVSGGFTYEQFKAEIDAGRPVLIHLYGHTMLGYGYDDTTDSSIYVHDTWDYDNHTMTWGGSYGGYPHIGVTVIELESSSKGTVSLDKDSYLPSDTVVVTVSDSDLDITGEPDTTTVEFTSDTEDVFPKTVILTETDDSTGIFTGSIKLTNKFLGNIGGGYNSGFDMPENFGVYWNQITTEDIGKWAEVESTQDVMEWDRLDTVYNYAKDNDFPFKQHTFVWGKQQPDWVKDDSLSADEVDWMKSRSLKNLQAEPMWLKSLSQEEQRAEVEEWIQSFCERYPDTDYIDVVNEPLNTVHPSYKDALGGDGTTGWDWVIWSFEKARQYCPNAKLLINEWGVLEEWGDASMTGYLEIINLLKDRGLIDGIGNQCHNLESANMTTVANNLDRLAATGLPIYITELDVVDADDDVQLGIYEDKFPVFWEHPSVGGITLWGYIEGMIWKPNGYLMEDDETTERPALTWLKEYTSSPSGILRVENGDTITVTYEDADDGTGDTALVTATAEISSVDTPTGLTATAGRNYVFLYWNPVESPIFARYNIYRSASLTGEKTKINGDRLITSASYQDLSLSLNTTYYYWVKAVDIYDDETDYSNVVVVTTGLSEESDDNGDNGEDGGNGGGGGSKAASLEGGCFIATACYGTPMASEVQALSAFRDEYLLSNSLGRFFVGNYYKFSPQVSEYISQRPILRKLVRFTLKPLVSFSEVLVEK